MSATEVGGSPEARGPRASGDGGCITLYDLGVLTEYIRAAMGAAHYEPMDDGHEDERFWGNIPPCQGVWAAGPTIERVRDELQEVLEDWLGFRMRRGLEVPVINGMRMCVRPTT